jgi:hypothetical protein
MASDGVVWLAGLLVIPGLFGLPMLMAWMETSFTRQMVAHQVEAAWEASLSPEETEEAIRASVARLFPAGR